MDKLDPKFGKFPVIGLKIDYSRSPATELMVFRAARAKLTEARMSPWLRRRLARAWLLYPAYLITEILIPWLRYSSAAYKAFGHHPLKQLPEVARLTLNDGPCGRKAYYHAGLAAHHGGPELTSYIHDQFHECLIMFCRYAVAQIYGPQPDLGNKHTLELACKKTHLPCITSFATVLPVGEIVYHGQHSRAEIERESSIFIKPAKGGQGKHAERWDRIAEGYLNSSGYKVESFDRLLKLVKEEARANDQHMLLQQSLVNSSQSHNYGSRALSTIRLVTFRTHNGDIVAVQAGMRIGTKRNAAVDNYHAEGIYFQVDHDTGVIGTGVSIDFPFKPVRQTISPLTGSVLTGSTVPGWEELYKLGISAHEKLTKDTICGWDLSNTNNGPCIIECNAVPSMDVASQKLAGGFLGTSFSKLLFDEIVHFLNYIEHGDSRYRINIENLS